MALILNDDTFYKHESGQILCGSCVRENLEKTRSGVYTGDEAMFEEDFKKIDDQDVAPYQCDDCLKQNEAYDLSEVADDEQIERKVR